MIDERRWVEPDIPVVDGRRASVGSGPIERSAMVRVIAPCEGCAHRTVCAIRPKLETEELSFRTPPTPDPAIRITLTATFGCEHYLADESVPPVELDARTISARRGGQTNRERIATAARNGGQATKAQRSGVTRAERLAARQAAVDGNGRRLRSDGPPSYAAATNAALRENGGRLLATARALGLKGGSTSITSRVAAMRAAGLLEPDVEQLLADRKAERESKAALS